MPLRVLLTSATFARRTGSDAYVEDLARGLLRRGHTPIVYCPDPSPVAFALRLATVPVVDDLERLTTPPDVIHGSHHLETMTACLRFPGVPALHVCHAWYHEEALPPRFPRIRRFVAVDDTCRDRLLFEEGIPEARVAVHRNAVDLERFQPRAPLPARPRRALVFSNYATQDTHLPAVRDACMRAGLALDVVGEGVGNACARPEEILGGYDVVFAKARCALEALAVGTAVVLCDAVGMGPLVTTDDLDRLRRQNLGWRALSTPVTAEGLVREIARYDPADALEVSRRIRATAGLAQAVEALEALYSAIVAEQRAAGPDDLAAEERAASGYLRTLLPRWSEMQALRADAGAAEERDRLRAELAAVRDTTTWRLRERLASRPWLRRAWRRVRPAVAPR